MQSCQQCGREFPRAVVVNGVRLNVSGRKRCLECRPHRPLSKPRKPVIHPVTLKLMKCVMLCANCHREVHAGHRDLDVLHGLADESTEYVA